MAGGNPVLLGLSLLQHGHCPVSRPRISLLWPSSVSDNKSRQRGKQPVLAFGIARQSSSSIHRVKGVRRIQRRNSSERHSTGASLSPRSQRPARASSQPLPSPRLPSPWPTTDRGAGKATQTTCLC